MPKPISITKKAAIEIVEKGLCLQEKILPERCAQCGSQLVLGVYKFQSRRLKQVISCKKCNTASRVR
jgi:hypothetical protein